MLRPILIRPKARIVRFGIPGIGAIAIMPNVGRKSWRISTRHSFLVAHRNVQVIVGTAKAFNH